MTWRSYSITFAPRSGGGVLDRERRAGVERDEDDDLGAIRQALVGLRLLLVSVTVGVGDHVRGLRRVERLHESRAILRLPANRRLGVGQQDADIGGRRALAGLRERCRHCHAYRGECDNGHDHKFLHDSPPGEIPIDGQRGKRTTVTSCSSTATAVEIIRLAFERSLHLLRLWRRPPPSRNARGTRRSESSAESPCS